MFGKPEWFGRRKYGGWGIFPKTWQGWTYLGVILVPMYVIQMLPFWTRDVRMVLFFAWIAFVFFDVIDIMIRLPRDERDRLHEALAERNALWVMVFILAVGIGYQAAASYVSGGVKVDPIIIAALVGGLIAKAVSNIYLDKKD